MRLYSASRGSAVENASPSSWLVVRVASATVCLVALKSILSLEPQSAAPRATRNRRSKTRSDYRERRTPSTGVEPVTPGFESRCSVRAELRGQTATGKPSERRPVWGVSLCPDVTMVPLVHRRDLNPEFPGEVSLRLDGRRDECGVAGKRLERKRSAANYTTAEVPPPGLEPGLPAPE